MNSEKEGHSEARVNFDIQTEKRTRRGKYKLYVIDGENKDLVYEGKLGKLADILISNSIVLRCIQKGWGILFVIHPKGVLSFPDLIGWSQVDFQNEVK